MNDPFEKQKKPKSEKELAKRTATGEVTATHVQAWTCPECYRKQISSKSEEHVGECCMCGTLVTVHPPRPRTTK